MTDQVQENHEKLLAVTQALKELVATIEAHEVTCFSCDRDGKQYCDCIQRQLPKAKLLLANLPA